MAAHNSAATIGQAIGSVLLQTRHDWELIVVDDGSTDSTAAIASSFDDARIRVVGQENRGPAAARNAGLRLARAPLVSTLDSDDLWLPDYLAVMGRALEAAPEAALAYTDAWVLDDATGRIRKTTEMAWQEPPDPPPEEPGAFFEELLRRNFVYNSVSARRDVLLALGGYDERLLTGEDWELWLRVAASGARCVRAPGILGVHRDHAHSLSADTRRMRAGKLEVYRIVERDWETDDGVRALARALRLACQRSSRRDELTGAALVLPRLVRRWLRRRTAWRRQPPREVANLLGAVDDVLRRDLPTTPARPPKTA